MTSLKPVDFKAVAAKGAYVYCYLREDGTPYYVGISSTAIRPLNPNHGCQLPLYDALVRIMRSGLSWQKACEWEKYYIQRFGRQDKSNGLLHNKTDGGDGVLGLKFSEESKKKMSEAGKAKVMNDAQIAAQQRFAERAKEPRGPMTEEHKAKLSKAAKERVISPAHLKALTTCWVGRKLTAEHKARISASLLGKPLSETTKRKLVEKAKNRTADHKAKIKEAHQRTVAAKYGVDPEWYLSLAPKAQRKMCSRFCYGKRGAALVAGLVAA